MFFSPIQSPVEKHPHLFNFETKYPPDSPYIRSAVQNFHTHYQGCLIDGMDFVIDLNKLQPSLAGKNSLEVATVGCHGEKPGDKSYPNKQIIKNLICKSNSDIVITAGDNWYKSGLKTYPPFKKKPLEKTGPRYEPMMEAFITDVLGYIDPAYTDPAFPTTPRPISRHIFNIAGNHDYGIEDEWAKLWHNIPTFQGSPASFGRLISQFEATYKSMGRYASQDNYPHMHFPYRYYTIVKKFSNGAAVIFYCLDSNFLLWDKAQHDYFLKTYLELERRFPTAVHFVVQHHPLISLGRRGGSHTDELKLYVNLLKETGDNKDYILNTPINLQDNMARLLYQYHRELRAGGMNITGFIAAHDHHTAVFQNLFGDPNVWEFNVGGGGGILQAINKEHVALIRSQNHHIHVDKEIFAYGQLKFSAEGNSIKLSASIIKQQGEVDWQGVWMPVVA